MEREKGIKLLKRVWTAVAVAGLVVAAGAQLFLFSHYFSYSVFASNLYDEAKAARYYHSLAEFADRATVTITPP